MIVLLNMHLTSKICDKFCLKAIRDALFPICGLQSGEGQEGDMKEGGDSILWWRGHPTEEGIFKIFGMRGRGVTHLSGKP